MNRFDLSLIIPFYNEEENISLFFNELIPIITKSNYIKNYEIICINDGSTDNTLNKLKFFQSNSNLIKIINLKNNLGQSNAINLGVKSSIFENCLTIDGDCQNDPNDINLLLYEFSKNFNFDLIAGERINRRDNFIKRISSRIANRFRNIILKDGCADTGCSLKFFKRSAFIKFSYFNGIHRFLPALFVGYGFKVKYLKVNHRYRKFGQSKYGTFKRLFKGLFNLYFVYREIKKYNNEL